MAPKDYQSVHSFDWLRREARGPTYISYSELSDRQACSFEFGENGCAASCNYGGELLSMSAKDEVQGIVFAHGDFERTYYSSLARAQRHDGGKAAFGLAIAPNQPPLRIPNLSESSYRLKLGPMTERGCFNYRWPFNEYALLLNEGEADLKEIGTCARVSFIKDDILYQIIRLEKGCRQADRSYHIPWSVDVTLAVGGAIEFTAFKTEPKNGESVEHSICDDVKVSRGLKTQLETRVRQVNGNRYDTLGLERPKREGSYAATDGQCYAYANLPQDKRQAAVIIAEFRLRKVDGESPAWPETPTPAQIYDHLGVHTHSKMATAVMWETIFLNREQQTNYFELSEINLIGRCVEKILTVDLVPTTCKTKEGFQFEMNEPLALVSNLFLRPNIDLESLFWKIRFLVKTYEFLATFHKLYLKSTKSTVPESSANLSPGVSNSNEKTVDDLVPQIELHHYEAKSAWNIPKITINWHMKRLKECIERSVAYLVMAFIHPDAQGSLFPPRPKVFQSSCYYVMMTLWYVVERCDHFQFEWKWVNIDSMTTWPTENSLLAETLSLDDMLPKTKEKEKMAFLKWYYNASVLNLFSSKDVLPTSWNEKRLRAKVNLLERDARRVVAAKLSASQPYSAEDEILDRLGFLATPLNAEYSNDQAGSVASLTIRRILNRDATRYLSPGRYSDGNKGLTSGPWEVHALCHHSRLLVEHYQARIKKLKPEGVEIYRRELLVFLNAEACLIPCWERTNMASFQSETTSVLASTLLDICKEDFSSTRPTIDNIRHDIKIDTPSLSLTEAPQCTLHALQRVDIGELAAIEWKRYKPPRLYHPPNFFNSIDDTPQLFESTTEDIADILEHYDITIIDLKASMPEQLESHIWQGYISDTLTIEKRNRSNQDEMTRARNKLSDSLVDQEVQHRTVILPAALNQTIDDNYLKPVCGVIHADSTDCFINHQSRFPDFSCQKGNTWVTRITLRSWSMSSVPRDVYDAWASRSGTFGSAPTPSGSMNITEYQDKLGEEDIRISLPPFLLKMLRSINPFISSEASHKESKNPSVVKLDVSSIVLSTNGLGDFSQCTIISERFDKKSKAIMEEKCKGIWEKFIHQPQTARCLVFLTIMGLLCRTMAADYRSAIKYFIWIAKIDRDSIFDGNSLLEGQYSLAQLQLGLWSLESLFKLRNSLESSMRCIEEASIELRAQIRYGPGRRNESLERMCQDSLESFERNLGKLYVLNAELKQKIELNNRYKDSLSTILSLEDSRNSLRQNSTIQKLTYLTIGYLPIGLITAIFAIPSDQNVLIPSMGLGGYVASVVTLCVVTFIATIFLKQLQQGFRKLIPNIPSFSSGGGVGRGLRSIFGKYWTRSRTATGRGGPSSSMTVDMEKG